MRVFQGHTMRVNGVAFSPDGRSLASCSTDGTLRLWDMAGGNGRVLSQVAHRREYEPRRTVSAGFDRIAFIGIGRLVCRSGSNGLKAWNFANRVYEIPLLTRTRADYAGGLAVTVAGGLVAANDWLPDPFGNIVRVWEVATWSERILHQSPETCSFSGLAFDPLGTRLATNAGIFDLTTGECVLETQLTGETLRWSPTAPLIASASENEDIDVINADTGELVVSLPHASKGPPRFEFSPGGYLAAVNHETIRVWETHNWAMVREFAWKAGWLTSLSFSPDGLLAACANTKGQILIWDWDL